MYTQTKILRFFKAPHRLAAYSKSNLSALGPSIEILIKQSRVDVISLFLKSVLILFIAEKLLSQVAVETGRVSPMHASLAKLDKGRREFGFLRSIA